MSLRKILPKTLTFIQRNTGHYYRAPGHRSLEQMRAAVAHKFGASEAARIKDVQHDFQPTQTVLSRTPETRCWVWTPEGI